MFKAEIELKLSVNGTVIYLVSHSVFSVNKGLISVIIHLYNQNLKRNLQNDELTLY